jgi:hypothetical protein
MVVWQGITSDGVSVPVQVTEDGKVVSQGQQGEQGPPGPPGEQGPPGPYGPGDDVEFGTATFAGGLTEIRPNGNIRKKQNVDDTHFIDIGTAADAVYIQSTSSGSAPQQPLKFFLKDGSTNHTHVFNQNGSVEFDGTIIQNNWNDDNRGGIRLTSGSSGGAISVKGNGQDFGAFSVRAGGTSSEDEVLKLSGDGSVSFASNKCGFTENGELYFTSRGVRYKAVVTGGLIVPEEFTREMEIKERIEQRRKPRPTDSVQED